LRCLHSARDCEQSEQVELCRASAEEFVYQVGERDSLKGHESLLRVREALIAE
jgi:hypothetical protein